MDIIELESFLNQTLKPELFDDYCPNGLQIEGSKNIKKIVFSVSATKESAEFAEKLKADALIVHHGIFWKFHGTRTLTGAFARRVFPLVRSQINLFGYHLPLDAHPQIGNAASIAKIIDLKNLSPFGLYKNTTTGIMGQFEQPMKIDHLKKILSEKINQRLLYSNPTDAPNTINSIGIITGGANSQWREALRLGLDAYLTGEMSEHDYHESREAGIHMFAAGHHATEKFGIQALMKLIETEFPKIECLFLDSDNPA